MVNRSWLRREADTSRPAPRATRGTPVSEMHFWDLRRIAHFGLLILLIVGIRACGGAIQAEDRLSFATRWAADKAGLSSAKDTLDTSVRPRMAAATQSMNYSINAATSRAIDGAESAVNGMATWVVQRVSKAETAVETRIRSLLGADTKSEPKQPDDTDPATSPSR